MSAQVCNTLLMVRPINIRANEQTASTNYFQGDTTEDAASVKLRALNEFDRFVETLRAAGIKVIVVTPSEGFESPDAHFPNNWVSFHANSDVAIYPMFAENRRKERDLSYFEALESDGFNIENIIDYTSAEAEGIFLEGTGSMILDRENRKAYCAISARTHEDLVIEFCEDFDYAPILFTANQTVGTRREAIYHTNVMLCIGTSFAVICLDAIDDKKERKQVIKELKRDGKELIAITEDQMASFAGNMLQVAGNDGKGTIIMSGAAYSSLRADQVASLSRHANILYSDVPTIEKLGGGSVRCMMAEVFLPRNS